MEGVRPSSIPLTYNREGALFFNARIGKKLGIEGAPALAKIVP
jgi:hypothetical protein